MTYSHHTTYCPQAFNLQHIHSLLFAFWVHDSHPYNTIETMLPSNNSILTPNKIHWHLFFIMWVCHHGLFICKQQLIHFPGSSPPTYYAVNPLSTTLIFLYLPSSLPIHKHWTAMVASHILDANPPFHGTSNSFPIILFYTPFFLNKTSSLFLLVSICL